MPSNLHLPAGDPTCTSAGKGIERTTSGEQPASDVSPEYILLAWIRNAVMMITGGFVVARFPIFFRQNAAGRGAASWFPGGSLWIGTSLVVLGVLVAVFAAAHHVRFLRKIAPADVLARERSLFAVGVALALAALGVAMTGYLLLLWTPR